VTPEAVIFDCDGVLVDSERHSVAAWLDVLGTLGHPATASDIEACTGLGFVPTHTALAAVAPLPPAATVWPGLLEALGRSFSTGLRIFPDALSVLETCVAGGIPVAVASASPRERLELTLQTAGLGHRFAVSVAGDDVEHPKPSPDVYLEAAARLGVSPSGCVAVEDTASGVVAAMAAGMRVVAVVREGADGSTLATTGARVVERLTPWVVGIGGQR
jgi:beta-phosphoglucomutase-like phosphatase (HAD superfamily)